ncbi:MAG TPA: SDR family oxidoreductase [Alphaproteobacteria bacterium]|nr:SDR family oxidoreductase [Alphaproteobacteria bacterium]
MSLPPLPVPVVPKAALVTGAAARIGRATALALAADGYAVAIHYNRSAAPAEQLADEIRQSGGKAITLQGDLSVEAQVEKLVPQATKALGPLGVLVNNASIFERDEALTATRESWDDHMETNLRAPFKLSQDFAKQLPAGQDGVIVNLLDERVLNLTPHFTTYTLSKAGLWTLTQTLASALAPRIRVVGIGPGPVLPSPHQTDEQFVEQYKAMPLQRPSSPDEIAGAVRFILATPSMTGQILLLDGGQHLGWSQPKGEPAH